MNADLISTSIQALLFSVGVFGGGGRWKRRLVDPPETPYLLFVGEADIDHAHCCACPTEAAVNEPAAFVLPLQNKTFPTEGSAE